MPIPRLLPFALLLLFTACEHAVPPKPPEALDFSGAPYRLNVGTIEVVKDYISPHGPANVEYLADVPPAKAIKQWVVARMVAAGRTGSLEVDIKDASIVKKDLPKKKHGLEGWFTKEQTEEYDGTLDVEMKIYSGHKALPVAHIEVSAFQSHTLREDATLVDRQALYHQMNVELMGQLNAELDKNIRQYFVHYLVM
jgi:hypothetical protein